MSTGTSAESSTHHAPCTRAVKDQDYCILFAMVWYNIPISLSLLFASGSLLIPSCHSFKCNLDPEKNTLNAALRLPRAHATNCTVNIYPPLSPTQMRIYKYTSTGGFHLQPIHKRKHNSNKTHTHPRNLLPSIRTPLRARWIGRTPRCRCRSRSRSCPADLQCLSHTR